MRFYKLRVTTNAPNTASIFNEQFKPEAIPEVNDPFRVDWITSSTDEESLVGDKASPIHSARRALINFGSSRLCDSRTQQHSAMYLDGRYTGETSIPESTLPINKF